MPTRPRPVPFQPANAADPIRDALVSFRAALTSCGLYSLVNNILLLASPLFMMQIYDRVLSSRSVPTLLALTGLILGLFVFAAAIEIVRLRLMARVASAFTQTLGRPAFRAIIDLELRSGAQVGNQPVRDLETLRAFLAGAGPTALFDTPWMPIYVLLAFMLHPLLGLMSLIAGLILIALAIANERLTAGATAQAATSALKAHTLIENARGGAEVLRAMGMEQAVTDRWSAAFESAQSSQIAATDTASTFNASTRYLRLFLQSATLALGAGLAIDGELSPGSIIAASIILSRALAPIEQITGQWASFQNARRAHVRLRQSLNAVAVVPVPMALPTPRGALTLENVAIQAPGGALAILSGVTFALAPGEALGVVGPSGSGKSTLARAIAGVWPASNGAVRIDGARLAEWPVAQLGRAIGYLPQDVELFSGTVADNIARFTPEPDPEAVVAAARRAGVHELILGLPDGYGTELGLRGAHLSGGQRQRIALARALFGAPKLLILDEPNANLDTLGEAALAETLADLKQEGVTVVIISHRPQSLRIVDTILVLSGGRQAALGPRDQIMAAQPAPSAAGGRVSAPGPVPMQAHQFRSGGLGQPVAATHWQSNRA